MVNLTIVILLSYIVGSIPTSIIASKISRGFDIRQHGSGNAGGTNVLRVLGWKIGLAVILFDLFKGVIATMFVARLFWIRRCRFKTELRSKILQLFRSSAVWPQFLATSGRSLPASEVAKGSYRSGYAVGFGAGRVRRRRCNFCCRFFKFSLCFSRLDCGSSGISVDNVLS